MSGGSRCNLTHALDVRGFVEAFGDQGPFLHSALAALGPEQLVDLIEAEGVATKVEPGGKIFPASDRADDVLQALLARLRQSGCTLAADEPVQTITPYSAGLRIVTAKRTLRAEAVILATGGQSYPSSGSTGDGYRWAAELGHTIVPPRPALVPITSHAPWVVGLQGITLSDVCVRVIDPGDGTARPVCLAQRRGALLFAHFGATGPAALDVSRAVSGHAQPGRLVLRCDLLPDRNIEVLGGPDPGGMSQHRPAIGRRDHRPLRPAAPGRDGCCPGRHRRRVRGAEVSRHQRQRLVTWLKQFDIPVSGTLGFNRAEVTAGGVALDEVDSHTMESRLVPGLFLAGEILDIDGPIGGYNFQAAFSTGWLAGENAS